VSALARLVRAITQILYIWEEKALHLLSHLHVWIRTDLSRSLKVVEMHTWSSDWKRVIIIIIIKALHAQGHWFSGLQAILMGPSIHTFHMQSTWCTICSPRGAVPRGLKTLVWNDC
jgi:hypothetical protein